MTKYSFYAVEVEEWGSYHANATLPADLIEQKYSKS